MPLGSGGKESSGSSGFRVGHPTLTGFAVIRPARTLAAWATATTPSTSTVRLHPARPRRGPRRGPRRRCRHGRVPLRAPRRGEASCPKCGKSCAGDDAVDGARLAVHRAPRGGRDRSAERGVGVDERADPADQADGVRVPEPRALPGRDQLPTRRAGLPSEAGLSPHDLSKRRNSVVRKVQHGI